MILAGDLPEDIPLCREGEELWQHATELFGSRPPAEAPAPIPVAVPVTANQPASGSDDRVCLNCGRIHRAGGAFCQHCGKALGVTKREYGGMGRLAYFGSLFGLGFFQGFLIAVIDSAEAAGAITIAFGILHLIVVIFRLQNIGMSGWWSLLMLVPIANLFISVYCLAYPEGYEDSKEMDTAGKIISGVILGCLVLVVLLVLIGVAAS